MVSEVCLGTMMFGTRCDEADSDRILSAPLERGVNFVDTAAMYAAGGTAVTAYRPLAEGVLAGWYQVGGPFPAGARGETSGPVITWLSQHGLSILRFNHYAADLRVAPATFAIAWPRYSPAVTSVIVGVSKLGQLDDTLASLV